MGSETISGLRSLFIPSRVPVAVVIEGNIDFTYCYMWTSILYVAESGRPCVKLKTSNGRGRRLEPRGQCRAKFVISHDLYPAACNCSKKNDQRTRRRRHDLPDTAPFYCHWITLHLTICTHSPDLSPFHDVTHPSSFLILFISGTISPD